MMRSLIVSRHATIHARDMSLAIVDGNDACFECLRVRLPSCIVMRLGSCSLLNLLAYVLFDVLHEEIYPSMVH